MYVDGMGVTEDINWLKTDKVGVGKVFTLLSDKGSLRLRELKELYGSGDWWPVKEHLRTLISRELVSELNSSYKLTDDGKKVLDGLKAIEYVQPI